MDKIKKAPRRYIGSTAMAAMIGISVILWYGAVRAAADEAIIGKWRRPDGGYIVEIRGADASGKLDAAYYNPYPINVAKAESSKEGGQIKVFIELRDVNYPGSAYNLVYDPGDDRLKGDYYQAVDGEHYDIYFERVR